jgi:ribosome assembly protein YihI (activator of Der GTPase)
MLLVDSERQVLGKTDLQSGQNIKMLENDTQTDDLLDDIAERVLMAGGKVFVLSSDRVPGTSGVAAVYRY